MGLLHYGCWQVADVVAKKPSVVPTDGTSFWVDLKRACYDETVLERWMVCYRGIQEIGGFKIFALIDT
jgi:hypothetical protein